MPISCCLCGRFIGHKEFEENKIIVDHNIQYVNIWGDIEEWEDIYHKSCGGKYGVIPYD